MLDTCEKSATAPVLEPANEDEATCLASGGQDVVRRYVNETLGTLAHELRSPLTTVIYALETIPDGHDSDPTTRWACTVAQRQVRLALRLIDDLFDVCASSWGKLSLCKEVASLTEIVTAATETVEHLLGARQHRLTVSLPLEPVTLDADPVRLEQVLTNLLANAAKFTEPGGHIRLTAEVKTGQIVLRVRDNGRGIALDQLPHVFDLLHQGPAPGDRTRGLGIGLALVKSLVELHGGSVTAFSAGPGTGSEFVVRLPTRACDA